MMQSDLIPASLDIKLQQRYDVLSTWWCCTHLETKQLLSKVSVEEKPYDAFLGTFRGLQNIHCQQTILDNRRR